jgi:hypothetical protein
MAKRLAAVIPVITDIRKTSDPIFLTWENKLTHNLGFQHDEGAAQKRNGMDNRSSNSEDVREEAELDIHIQGKSEEKCFLPKRLRKCPEIRS